MADQHAPPTVRWSVLPTGATERVRFPNEYCIVLPSAHRTRIGRVRYVVVGRMAPPAHGFRGGMITTLGRVAFADDLADQTVRLDQTLRTSLGMFGPHGGGTVSFDGFIEPLSLRWSERLADRAARTIGMRTVVLRSTPPEVGDIEKDVVLVASNDLAALGVQVGDRVVMTTPRYESGRFVRVQTSTTVLTYTDGFPAERRAAEASQAPVSGRYVSPRVLRIDHASHPDAHDCDLRRIQIDAAVRERMGLTSISPVTVRRDAHSVLLREVQEFGVTLLATLLAFQTFVDAALGSALGAAARAYTVLVAAALLSAAVVRRRLRSPIVATSYRRARAVHR